jgi:hypothetical protein
MSITQHSVKLIPYDAVTLNSLSYNNGDVVFDYTNNTIRVMDGITAGGWPIATQAWVINNTLNSSNLSSALGSALSGYVTATELTSANYVTQSELTSALSTVTSAYTLPTASTVTLGGVKVDGTTITINGSGVISGANTYTLPIAQSATGGNSLGGVIPDGTTITINPSTGVITGAELYVLPAATTSTLGGVKIPAVGTSGLTNTSGTIGLATASTSQLGGVIVDGTSITISSGTISATPYTLPAATTSTLGGVIIGSTIVSGLINTSGTIKLATASISQLGGVKVDGSTITISNGVITANLPSAITFAGTWSAALNSPLLSNGTGTNGYEYVCVASGTVNFGAGNIAFSVGDIVIYTSGVWTRIPASSSSGTTNYPVTFTNTGGAAEGTTFNGSSGVTVSYATVGAEPAGGSSDIATVGTVTSGTWNAILISPTYGGTGVNNGSNTLTLAGNLTTVGAYSTTITSTALTSVTLPTSGTLISSVTPLGGAVTGTPSSGTFLRGDGTWAAPAGGLSYASFSVTTASPSGTTDSLSYNNSSGVFTFTPLNLASPPAIGGTTPAAGSFTTLSASQQITSTIATGTAPFVVSSTTNVANLNASSLNGATFASPGAIGGTTAGTILGTTIKATGSSAAIGYNTGSGAGGTVTQSSSRTTGVTLSKITGSITLFSTTTTAGQTTTFIVTNTTVAAVDTIVVTQQTGSGVYFFSTKAAAGSFSLSVYTPTAVSSAEAPVINFAVIKGSAN